MNRALVIASSLAAPLTSQATGLAACDSGPTSGGHAAEKLEQQPVGQEWTARRATRATTLSARG